MTEPMKKQTAQLTRQNVEAHLVAKAWKDEAFKQELLSNPKTVIEREFDIQLPENLNVQILEENSHTVYFPIPTRPDLSTVELSDQELEAVAGGTTPLVVIGTVEATIATYISARTIFDHGGGGSKWNGLW